MKLLLAILITLLLSPLFLTRSIVLGLIDWRMGFIDWKKNYQPNLN